MELQITGKNVDLSPAARRHVEHKLGKLSRYLPSIMESVVEISEEKTKFPQQRFVVQVTVHSNTTLLRAEERGEDLLSAVDKAAATMERQIERHKGKLYAKGRGTSVAKSKGSEETEVEPSREVVRVKRFAIKPMSATEAIDQMELLGHDFFLFYNTDSEELNLLYQRRDGNYGLIEPEFG
ncbi:ribosome hibernation-promoting factor, HPF/YfiA family [Chloroflexota bacterium]